MPDSSGGNWKFQRDDLIISSASFVHASHSAFCSCNHATSLQEVMEDPQIAADGYTYEHRAIKLWLERYSVSPVSKRRLPHKLVMPNHTLRLAIQEWGSTLNVVQIEKN